MITKIIWKWRSDIKIPWWITWVLNRYNSWLHVGNWNDNERRSVWFLWNVELLCNVEYLWSRLFMVMALVVNMTNSWSLANYDQETKTKLIILQFKDGNFLSDLRKLALKILITGQGKEYQVLLNMKISIFIVFKYSITWVFSRGTSHWLFPLNNLDWNKMPNN